MAEFALLAASAVSAIGSVVEGISANNAASANAKAMKSEARAQGAAGAQQEAAILRDNRKLQGEQLSAIGANGLNLSGSALDFTLDQAVEAEMKALDARYQSNARATALKNQARVTKWEGKQALYSGIIGAASKGLSGYAQYENRPKRG